MNRFAIGIALLCGFCTIPASAQEQMKMKINWAEWKDQQRLKHGEVLSAEGDQPERLRVVKTTTGDEFIPLFEIDQPALQGRVYVLKGRVKYADVAPGTGPYDAGFLEMWNYFPDGSAYFTRTLGDSGPMAKFVGTSDWRDVALPFDKADQPSPTKLVVNLHLPGPGTVELSPLELFDNVSHEPARVPGAWWDDRTAGLIGALGGTIIGLLGGAIGVAVGVFKQRTVGNVLSATLLVFGVLALIAGVIAVTQSQPYAVYYPLLLLGGISTLCSMINLIVIRLGFHQAELRRMQALDVQ